MTDHALGWGIIGCGSVVEIKSGPSILQAGRSRIVAAQTFCAQFTCGYSGYLPTARAMQGGHYGAEVASNQVGPEGGQAMVDRTVALIEELWKEA